MFLLHRETPEPVTPIFFMRFHTGKIYKSVVSLLPCTLYMAARKFLTVGFECSTLATNSMFMDSRNVFVRLSLLIVLEGLRQDVTARTTSWNPRTGGFFMLCNAGTVQPETVELVEYLDSLKNVM